MPVGMNIEEAEERKPRIKVTFMLIGVVLIFFGRAVVGNIKIGEIDFGILGTLIMLAGVLIMFWGIFAEHFGLNKKKKKPKGDAFSEEMKFCPKCGEEIPASETVCPECDYEFE